MNADNLRAWIKALREGGYHQVNGRLAAAAGPDQEVGFCCLGVGCLVAGIIEPLNPEAEATLPPVSFATWLGVELPPGAEDFGMSSTTDLVLDVPSAYLVIDGYDDDGTPYARKPDDTCAGLNDNWGLTFDQIADMVEYFGIKGID